MKIANRALVAAALCAGAGLAALPSAGGQAGGSAPAVGYDPLGAALDEAAVERAAGRFDAALAAVERGLSYAPRDPDARLARARLLLALSRPVEALDVLDPLIAERGPSARALTERGIALVRVGRSAEGERDLREALTLYPANGPARAELIELLRTGERADEARQQLTRLRLQAPELAWAVAADARLRAGEGHADAALAELEAALGRDDRLGSLRRAAIEIALAAERPGRALDAAAPWLASPETAPDGAALTLAARAARANGRDLDALRASLAALERDDASAAALDGAIELLEQSDRLVETLLRGRLAERDDDVARAWLARRALDDGRLGEALELVGAEPATDELRLLRAEGLRRAGREAEAIAALDVLCVDGGPPRAFYERALARFARGDLDAAATDFERAAVGDLTALAQFNRGAVFDRLGRYTEAAAAYEAAVAADPDLAQAWMQLGNAYHFRLGDRVRAAEAYRRFLAVAGEDAQVRAWLEEVE